jgi:hypothetical protein
MVCKKNTSGLYWFGLKNALRPVRKKRLVLSCTKCLWQGLHAGEKGGVSPGLKMRVACVCDSAGALARSRRVVCSCVSSFLRAVPACSFYSLKEVQGYKMLVHGAILVGERAPRPREGLIWWGCGLHCRGMAVVLLALWLHGQACAPLLEEWSLSLGAVATCLDGRIFIAMKRRIMFITVATCLPLRL